REHFDRALAIEARSALGPLMRTLAGVVDMWRADYLAARDRFARVVAQRRAEGALTELVPALFVLSAAELCCGRTQLGLDAAGEGLELISQLGDASDALAYYALRAWIDALLGNERECRDLAARATKLGLASGFGYAVNEAHLALCQLEA